MLASDFEPPRHLQLLGLWGLIHGDELEIPSPVLLPVAHGNQRRFPNLSLPVLGFCCVDDHWLSCQSIKVIQEPSTDPQAPLWPFRARQVFLLPKQGHKNSDRFTSPGAAADSQAAELLLSNFCHARIPRGMNQ